MASPAGTRLSETATLKRIHARRPCERRSTAPSSESTTRSAIVGRTPISRAHLEDHIQLQQRDGDEEDQQQREHLTPDYCRETGYARTGSGSTCTP